ncbi:MAG: polysaccharide deacetylase family protein [Clostridia bacterium]|nr:polysaccharide deacetylase family protein [Clostridia bacterium]
MFRQMFEEKYMRFPGGKAKAMTFSYDDGVKADLRLLKVFEKYGLKGAFNLNSKLFDCENWHGRMDEQTTFNAFYKSGQEVALHGARHIFLNKVPLHEAIKEVVDNRVYLEEKFGKIVRGMAYAYNGYNADIKRVLADLGVAYARTTISTYTFGLPEDFLEWNPTCHHTDERLESIADKFFGASPQDEFKHREPWLFFVWGHSYEFDDDNNWQVIENLGKRAAERSDIWHATNIEIYEYAQAYKRLVFSLDGERAYNLSAIDVWLEIRGKVYKIASGATVQFDK